MVAAVVVYILICVVLVGLILLQQNQGGGLGILGGSSSSLLGTTQESFIGKVIKFMAAMFVLGAVFLSIMSTGGKTLLDEELPEAPATTNEAPILEDEIDATLDSEELPSLEELPSEGLDSTSPPSLEESLDDLSPSEDSSPEGPTPKKEPSE